MKFEITGSSLETLPSVVERNSFFNVIIITRNGNKRICGTQLQYVEFGKDYLFSHQT